MLFACSDQNVCKPKPPIAQAGAKTAVLLPAFRIIASACFSTLVAACTNDASEIDKIDIGDSVLLKEYAIACEQPSSDLNRITMSNGKDRRDLTAKISHLGGCYDASHFEKGRWEVLATNDTQLLIKMPNYSGQYWVSNAQVQRGEPEVIKLEASQLDSP